MEGRESRWVSRHRSRGQYPSSYECESNGNLSVDTTTLSFAFEFIVAHPNEPIDEILVQDLPLLEYGILYRIGYASGILRCEFSEQAVDPWLLSTNNTSSANQSLVVALASNPSTLSDSQRKSDAPLLPKALTAALFQQNVNSSIPKNLNYVYQ